LVEETGTLFELLELSSIKPPPSGWLRTGADLGVGGAAGYSVIYVIL
jgi:hypothetical protein